MPLDRIGDAGEPGLVDVDGRLELRWPDTPAATVEVATPLLDLLLDQVNVGRRALGVLGDVAVALTKLADPLT